MKKTFAVLLLLASSYNVCSVLNYLYDGFLLGDFGSKPLSMENEQFVRQTLRKIDYKNADTIRIRRLSKQSIFSGFTDHNACAVELPGLPKYMFISEDWFNTLSENQKIFLIGHEGYHLKNNHILAQGLLLIFFWRHAVNYLRAYTEVNKKNELLYYVCYGVLPLIFCALSRYQEYEADRCSALTLGNIDGGIDWCKDMIAYKQDWESELSQWTISKWNRAILKVLFAPLRTHPETKNRLQALEALR